MSGFIFDINSIKQQVGENAAAAGVSLDVSSDSVTAAVDNLVDGIQDGPSMQENKIPSYQQMFTAFCMAWGVTYDASNRFFDMLSSEQRAAYCANMQYYARAGLSSLRSPSFNDDDLANLTNAFRNGWTMAQYHCSGSVIRYISSEAALGLINTYLVDVMKQEPLYVNGSIHHANNPISGELFMFLFNKALDKVDKSKYPDNPIDCMYNYTISSIVSWGPFANSEFMFLVEQGENVTMVQEFHEHIHSVRQSGVNVQILNQFQSKYVDPTRFHLPVMNPDPILAALEEGVPKGTVAVANNGSVSYVNMQSFMGKIRDSRFLPSMPGVAKLSELVLKKLISNLLLSNDSVTYLGPDISKIDRDADVFSSSAEYLPRRDDMVVMNSSFQPENSGVSGTVVGQQLEYISDLTLKGVVVFLLTRIGDWPSVNVGALSVQQIHPVYDLAVMMFAGSTDAPGPESTVIHVNDNFNHSLLRSSVDNWFFAYNAIAGGQSDIFSVEDALADKALSLGMTVKVPWIPTLPKASLVESRSTLSFGLGGERREMPEEKADKLNNLF